MYIILKLLTKTICHKKNCNTLKETTVILKLNKNYSPSFFTLKSKLISVVSIPHNISISVLAFKFAVVIA